MKNYSVFSVVVTFNPDLSTLKRQIESLSSQVDNMIFVDNGSNNSSEIRELIESESLKVDKDIFIIQNEKNVGLGAAQNKGIARCIENGASHVLLLDHDSILDNHFVVNLLESQERLLVSKIKVGALGPIYYNESTGEVYPITKYKGPFIQRVIPSESAVEASFLIASGCLIRTEVLKEVGLMNEDLFIDYIDVDWSFRAKNLGYKLFAAPKAKMKHTIGDNRTSVFGRTVSVHSPLRRYYLYRNSVYMVRNATIPIGYKVREITFNALRLLVFLFLSSERKKYLKYSIFGFLDGFKGVVGKCPHLEN